MESFFSKFVVSNRMGYRIARHAIFWFCWLIFHTIIYGSFWKFPGQPLYAPLVEALIFMPVHIFLSYSIIYFLLPRYLFRGKYFSAITCFIVLILATALLSHIFSITFIAYFRHQVGTDAPGSSLVYGLMAGLRGSNTIAGFATAIKLVKHWYIKKRENEQLEKEKLKAELDVLKGQLHPHFLFNTLNNLYSLILQKSKDAPEVVLRLSELLRYMLTESSKNKISLTQEIAILNDYIALEQIRFGNRLDLTVNFYGNMENKMIAPLLLLPFAENAFKHGANEMLDQPWVSLDIFLDNNTLKFKLINGKTMTGRILYFHQALDYRMSEEDWRCFISKSTS
ncbi:MAG: histidine kinase [Bacteroidota bacterium]